MNYSFIIPHKNSFDLVTRCLDSIPLEREDIEVIIVDDNSKDAENQFKSIKKKYPQLKIILTTEGKGAGYARNIGLKEVRGKWIIFTDADDFFLPELNTILDDYINCEDDIVFFNTTSCYSETLEPCENRIPSLNKYIKNRDVDALKWKVHVVWGKLYSNSLIRENNIKFDEVIAYNDVMFATYSAYQVKASYIDDRYLYCSTVNSESLSYKIDINNLNAKLNVIIEYNTLIINNRRIRYYMSGLNLLLYYRKISWSVFLKKCFYYSKKMPIYLLVYDIIRSMYRLTLNYRKIIEAKKQQIVTP